jgi:hypothetical protein
MWLAGAFTIWLALSASALADTAVKPAGWIDDADKAVALTKQLGSVPHFGGAQAVVTTHAYRAPSGGAALYVTRAIANVVGSAEQRARAAAAELDELRAAVRRHSEQMPQRATRRSLDDRALEAQLAWAGTDLDIESRMVIAADDQRMVAASGECVLAKGVAAEVADACRRALATLDPDVPAASRVALALAPEPARSTSTLPPAPSMTDGGEAKFPPMRVEAKAETDRRPVYVGAGLVLLAALFWWNRRRREQLENEHAPRATPARAADADADALHAAAEDDKTP